MSQKHFYDFDGYRIDAEDRVLLRDGEVLPLTQKAFDVLFLLVQRANRLVTKEELMSEVWPDTFVEEGNLSQNVYTLRKTLGEAYIRTVPRRGYRFEAEVRESGAEAIDIPTEELLRILELKGKKLTDAPPEPALNEPAPAARPSRRLGALGLVAVALLALGGLVWLSPKLFRAPRNEEKIALENLTTTGNVQCVAISPDGQYVAYAIADKPHLSSLHVRQLSTMATRTIVPSAETQYFSLTFSPDGNFIYFVSRDHDAPARNLSRVPMLGDMPRRLLAGVETAVSFSPDGKQLAFRRGMQDRRESVVFLANADGSGERPLARSPYPNFFGDPAWSPDGEVIACALGHAEGGLKMNVAAIRVRDGAMRVFTPRPWRWIGSMAWLPESNGLLMIGSDGPASPYQVWRLAYPSGETRRLTNDSNTYNRLSASSDGRALILLEPKRTTSLWIGPLDAPATARKLTPGVGGYRGALAWLPDGRIVFDAESGNALGISVMDADGSNQRQLLGDATKQAIAGYVATTPDGRRVVYYSDLSGVRHLWRIDIDGTHPVQLTNGNGEDHPAVSPDGRWVFYTRKEEAGSGMPTIWKISIDGGAPAQVTDAFTAFPAVSPDGASIVCFYSKDTNTPGQLAIFPSAGGPPIKVFPQFPRGATTAIWTPDGRAIVYADNSPGPASLLRQPIEGGAPTPLLTLDSDQFFGFNISPDGKRLGYVRGRWTSNAVLLRRTE
ncbi:MAG: winged helix-turn-helix domain-containing protein [Blastocatellia bacterium]|nr:winged helix-turn-helix domain-containing protein [Blastocatellia bacterium]